MYLRFVCAWLVIIAVAGLDAYLTVKHSDVMNDVELNPVGMMVLKSAGGVPLLIGLKTAGVALALLFCFSLWQSPAIRRKVLLATYAVAGLSLSMLVVMNDDSLRTEFIEENQRNLNAARMAPEQILNHHKMLRLDGQPERSTQQSSPHLTDRWDWSIDHESTTAISPITVLPTSSAL